MLIAQKRGNCSVALFTKNFTIKKCCKCKTNIKNSFTKILTIILSVKIPFQCSKVYRLHDQTNQDNSFNFRFQIGNDGQSKRLLVNLGRNLLFHYYFILFLFDKNRNTGFSSGHLLRLQQFCMNSRFRNGSFWIQ